MHGVSTLLYQFLKANDTAKSKFQYHYLLYIFCDAFFVYGIDIFLQPAFFEKKDVVDTVFTVDLIALFSILN